MNKVISREYVEKNYMYKDVIRGIIDECIPKGKNIITDEEEYKPNTNASSYLTQRILKLLEETKDANK